MINIYILKSIFFEIFLFKTSKMNFFDFIAHCACCAKMQKKSYAFINYVCFFLCFKCEVKTCFLFSSSQELKSCYFASFFPCKYECQLTSFEYISSFMQYTTVICKQYYSEFLQYVFAICFSKFSPSSKIDSTFYVSLYYWFIFFVVLVSFLCCAICTTLESFEMTHRKIYTV